MALSLAACGDPCEKAATMTPSFEVGLGEDAFTLLDPETPMLPDFGPQGGRHVWMGVSTVGISPGTRDDPTEVHISLTDPEDDTAFYGQGAWYGRLKGDVTSGAAAGVQVYVSDYDLNGTPIGSALTPVQVSARVMDECGTDLFSQLSAVLDLR
jgi:hypothetical protein